VYTNTAGTVGGAATGATLAHTGGAGTLATLATAIVLLAVGYALFNLAPRIRRGR